MKHISLFPRNGFALFLCLLFGAVLSGCITLDCKDCQKCGDAGVQGGGEACRYRNATPAVPGPGGCTSGKVCTGGGTCPGGCVTVPGSPTTPCSCPCT